MKSSILGCLLVAASLVGSHAASLGSAFTYQGRLMDAGSAASGEFDFRFTLFNAKVSGGQIGSILTNENVWVTNGVFTTALDFGTNIFTGQALWLEIAVRPGASAGAFIPLDPRQPLTAAPYALYALTPSGPIGPPGDKGDTGPAGPPGSADAWGRLGNAGTDPATNFIGTTDGQPFEVRVNGARAMRLAPSAGVVNLIAGGNGNHVSASASGSVIGGGGGAAGSSDTNVITSSFATISGGRRNSVSSVGVTVGGGEDNDISFAPSATISGGSSNTITLNATNAIIAGGFFNTIQTASFALIGGGQVNAVSGSRSGTIGGGEQNDLVGAAYGTISGGRSNSISGNSAGAAIGGGVLNRVGVISAGSTIGGGSENEVETFAEHSFIGGGRSNTISANSPWSVINGGIFNRIGTFSPHTFIGGGSENEILPLADNSTIVGGENNLIETNANHSFIGGGLGNEIRDSSDFAVISGGTGNFIQLAADFSTIGGGRINRIGAGAIYATVPGGYLNEANADYSFAAGRQAKAQHTGSFVWADSVGADFASTGINQFLIRAAGGVGINVVNPEAPLHVYGAADATLTGGGIAILGSLTSQNMVLDNNEIQARNNSAASPLFLNAGGGNVSIGTATANARLRVVNATCDGEVWSNSSDRNLKTAFETVDTGAILEKVAALPISRWHYTNAPGTRHVGRMAQDFQAAFSVGSDDKHIATIDADGVALAAIQGLNALLRAQAAELQALKQELTELRGLVGRREQ